MKNLDINYLFADIGWVLDKGPRSNPTKKWLFAVDMTEPVCRMIFYFPTQELAVRAQDQMIKDKELAEDLRPLEKRD